jgi:hypothetical protein
MNGKAKRPIKKKAEHLFIPEGFNETQRALWIQIQEEKRSPNPCMEKIRELAKELTEEDMIETRISGDPGGRSRSPSFGVWEKDDEQLYP